MGRCWKNEMRAKEKPVTGYTSRGCIDLVSASSAEFRKHYGFVCVDRNGDGFGTLERYKKKSFFWYKKS